MKTFAIIVMPATADARYFLVRANRKEEVIEVAKRDEEFADCLRRSGSDDDFLVRGPIGTRKRVVAI